MKIDVLNAMVNNAALLLVLSVIYDLFYKFPSKYRRIHSVYSGAMIALICVAIMKMSFELNDGVFFDTRTILLSVAALIFGFVPTVITASAAVILRLTTGGGGTLVGLATILSSALIGLAWRYIPLRKKIKRQWLSILVMSVAVHAAMLACMMLLPYPENLNTLKAIALPVMLVYPLASVLLGMLLVRQQEYKKVQSQLKQSEERFKSLFRQAPIGYQSLDADGNFIEINQQWLDTLGYSRDEVIGKWFGDFLFPKDIQSFRERFELYKTQGYISTEIEIPHKDTTPIFFSVKGKIGYDTNGEFKQTHCVFQDITKQRLAEEELLASEEKFRRLYETMSQGVLYQDAEGVIVSANPAAESILDLDLNRMGKAKAVTLGRRIVREDGSEMAREDYPAIIALRTGKPVGPVILGIFLPQKNDCIWLSVNGIPLFRPGEPKPYQVYTTFEDITAERKASQEYQLLFKEMVDGFALHEMIYNEHGEPIDYRFLAVNPGFENMTGLKSPEIIGKTVMEIMPQTERYWIETFGKVALTGEPVKFENYAVASDKYYEVSAYQPAPNQFACTFSDVTKRVEAEKALKESEEKYSSYIERSPYAVFVIDESGRFIEVNKSSETITGYTREQLLGMSVLDLTVEESKDAAREKWKLLKENGFANADLQYIPKNESVHWWSLEAVKLTDNQYLVFAIDITGKKKAEAELWHLSYHDFLTGIYNRRYFESELRHLDTPENLPLSIIMADINGVKLVNDAYGHAEGDRLIVDCVKIMFTCCRRTDILARVGGDEFAIILPRTDSVEAMGVLKKIQSSLVAFDQNTQNGKFRHSVSLGFSTKSSPEEELAHTVSVAEKYMYQRKLLEHSSSQSAIVSSIKATMFEKSQETEEHAERLAILSRAVARELNLSQYDQDRIELLATLHDIGKIGINDYILTKQGKLDAEEWVEMKRHPEIGYRIAMASPDLMPIAESILCHHERWDGDGYPQGLKGESIPLLSRILAVVDSYDAMTQDRSYRKAMTHEEAIKEVEQNAGTQFDPDIARLFIKILEKKMR